jgi:hypothetical protein
MGWWGVLALCVVAATAFYTDLGRLCNPVGEKYIPPFAPGQMDFSYPYLGARALLAGVNPYRNDRPEFTHSAFALQVIQGKEFKQLYPPGHLLLYVPLAAWKGADWAAAGRIWFNLSLLGLVGLAVLVWWMARRVMEEPFTPVWIPVFLVCLALNPGVELGLERGQSDVVSALLCWSAAFLFLLGHRAAAIFLATCVTSIKGYPVLFAAGLGILALGGKHRTRVLVAATAAVALVLIPVAPYLGDATAATRHRSDMFWPMWFNHGFRNAVYQIAPGWADDGRQWLSMIAFAITVGAWIRARRAFARGTLADRALWLTVFATASLGTMIGYSSLSVAYNLILVLPGALILTACQRRISALLAVPRWAEHLLGAGMLFCSFLLFVYYLGTETASLRLQSGISAASYGLLALLFTLAVLLGRSFTSPVPLTGEGRVSSSGESPTAL